jgi:hypothetical protein
MRLPKIVFRKSTGSSEVTNDPSVENGGLAKSGRRRQDCINVINSNQNLNLDRRASNSDRRVNDDHNYKGPARRYTIDRRMSAKERRNEI